MTITVIFKSTLQKHGDNLKEATNAYRAQISTTERRLIAKAEGQKADAITAYVNKVNSLSFDLNERYPQILENYQEAISTYVSDLEAAKFSSEKIKTKAEDINSIKEWLSNTKKTEFLNKGNELDTAIKKATTALAMEPMSIELTLDPNKYVETVGQLLVDAGNKRQNTHNELMAGFNTFLPKMKEVEASFAGMNETLKNAQFISSLPASEVLELISKEYLTSENMNSLDSIQSSGDGKVLGIILREPEYKDSTDFFRALGSADVEHVSNPMMDIVYNRVNVEFETVETNNYGELRNIRAFVYAISNQDKDKAKIYFEKMVLAGDRYAGVITTTARALIPELPDATEGNDAFAEYDETLLKAYPQLWEFNKKLKKAGYLSTLFESLYCVNPGKDYGTLKRDGYVSTIDRSVQIGELTLNKDFGFEFTITRKGSKDKSEVSTAFYKDANGVQNAAALKEREELLEKRKKAAVEFVADLAKIAGDKYIPGSSNLLEMVSSVVSVDETLSSRLDLVDSGGKATFTSLYKSAVGDKVENMSKIAEHLEKFGEIEKDLKTKDNIIKSNIFDIGGRSLTGAGDKDYVKFDINYDLQAILKMDDMKKNGVRSFVYHNTEGDINKKMDALSNFDRTVRGFEDKNNKKLTFDNSRDETNLRNMTEETYNLLSGQSDKPVSSVPIADIDKGLNKLNVMFDDDIFDKEDYMKWDQFKIIEQDKKPDFKQSMLPKTSVPRN